MKGEYILKTNKRIPESILTQLKTSLNLPYINYGNTNHSHCYFLPISDLTPEIIEIISKSNPSSLVIPNKKYKDLDEKIQSIEKLFWLKKKDPQKYFKNQPSSHLFEYLFSTKKEIPESTRSSLSKLLGYDIMPGHKHIKNSKVHLNKNTDISLTEESSFYYFFSRKSLSPKQFTEIANLNPIKFKISTKDSINLGNIIKNISKYSWLEIIKENN